MSLYSFGKPIVYAFYKIFFRISVEGVENIPNEGGVLICSNHLSNFDPPLIGILIKRSLSFVAKEELFKIPFLGRLLRHLQAFPIKRGSGDRGAIRTAMQLLRNGHALLIFPEGHRNPNAPLRQGLSGAGFFALKTDASIIPCAIIGHYGFRERMKVVFGSPIDSDLLKRQINKSSEASAVIMKHIQELLDRQQ
ncbi:1-acyl-sn-glycerol-3-phosphate acyltransferase [Sporolactobacillus shoreae]|uniref:1-acyl-sn-glycerol-3-phosphate acyltransferase n=1 Tax=Sporolactobacillus shoreae TaxID=1465501 RepID=A0A4Z0GM76_9BACL|nr:lysophospholipid acyltransferase family protein [Sporolactobacillus shoreae]TGA98139.1 1-acyl-sn-glycerol-3-phosphate acyltransferase [Sporolactobacillus shoreae]